MEKPHHPNEKQPLLSDAQDQEATPEITAGNDKFAGSMSFSSSVFNMINTIIGSGFLTLPYNLKIDGYVNGIMLLYVLALCATASAFCLIDVSNHINCYTYKQIASVLVGSDVFGYVIAIITLIHVFGSLTSYAIIIQDNFFFFAEDDFTSKQLLFWPIMLLFAFPLSCFKKLDFLHFCSYVTISVVVYIALVSIIYFFDKTDEPDPPTAFKFSAEFFSTLPLFQSAWCFHYQIGNVYRDLRDRCPARMNLAISLNILLVLLLYTLVAVFGYFSFTNYLQSDLLAAFSYIVGDVVYIKAANVLMLLAMVAHYPLPCFGMRRIVESLFWKDDDAPTKWRILIALVIIVVCSLCGSFIKEISDIIGFTSSISGSCVVFLFPGLFEVLLWRKAGGKARLAVGAGFMILGAFILVSGLSMQIVTLIDKYGNK